MLLRIWLRLVLQLLLEVVGEIPIGIVFRRIGGQEYQFDVVAMFRDPVPHLHRMVDPEVIDDQEQLTRCPSMRRRRKAMNKFACNAPLKHMNHISPRSFTAEIMLVLSFFAVQRTTGVCPFGA